MSVTADQNGESETETKQRPTEPNLLGKARLVAVAVAGAGAVAEEIASNK